MLLLPTAAAAAAAAAITTGVGMWPDACVVQLAAEFVVQVDCGL